MKRNLLLIMILFMAGACLDDKTNYDYKDINNYDGKWKIEGMESKYSLYPGESVVITPRVRLSMDTLNPELNHSWLLDGVEVGTDASYTFNAEVYGSYELIYQAIDKKTGVAFLKSATMGVSPVYKLGWLFLSRTASGNTRLSMLSAKNQIIAFKNESGYNDTRDSMVYTGFHTNLGEALGTGPIKLREEYCYPSDLIEESEIMVLQKSGPVELGGNALTFTGRPLDEFAGGISSDLKVKDAVLGWSSKWLQTEDNLLHFSVASVFTDLHSGRYSSDPAFNGAKYHTLIGVMKADDQPANVFLAIDETNTMWALVDQAAKKNGGGNMMDPFNYVGARASLRNNAQGDFDMSLFHNFTGRYIQHVFTPSKTYFLSLLERDGKYLWHKYFVETPHGYKGEQIITLKESTTGMFASPEMFTNFKEAALVVDYDFQWLFVASGNKLYGTVMDWKKTGTETQANKEFFTTSSDIVSVKARYFNYSLNNYIHLGVLLADGTFQVLEVNYDTQAATFTTKMIYNQNLKTLDPEISEIVDMIHKYGEGDNLGSGRVN